MLNIDTTCFNSNSIMPPEADGYYVYILMCSDKTYYTGWTTNIAARMDVHNSGKGAKYTRSRLPVELVYYEAFDSKGAAMGREWHIKKLSRAQKEKLISSI